MTEDNVVRAFMRAYYNAILANDDNVSGVTNVVKFMGKESKISYKFNDTEYVADGRDEVKAKLATISEQMTDLEVLERHFTLIDDQSISCVVVGKIKIDMSPWQIFSHNFILRKKKASNYYLLVDVLRIFSKDIFETEDEEGDDEVVEEKAEPAETVSAPAQQQTSTATSKVAPPTSAPPTNKESANVAKRDKAPVSSGKENGGKPMKANGQQGKKPEGKAAAEKGGTNNNGAQQQKQQNGAKKNADGGNGKGNPSAKQAAQAKPPPGPPKPKTWASLAKSNAEVPVKENPSVRRPSLGSKGQDGKKKASSGGGDKKDDGKSGGKKKSNDQGKKDKNNGAKQKQSTDTILFVKNIDPDATVKELKDLFNKFGNVKNVDQLKRKPTQEKGTAYVGFNSPKSLERALDETKGTMMFKGQPINIEAAKASVQAAAQKKSGGNRGGRGRGGKNKDKNRRGTKGNNNDNKSNGKNNNNRSRNNNNSNGSNKNRK